MGCWRHRECEWLQNKNNRCENEDIGREELFFFICKSVFVLCIIIFINAIWGSRHYQIRYGISQLTHVKQAGGEIENKAWSRVKFQDASQDKNQPSWHLLLAWMDLIPVWISNRMHYEVRDEITYPSQTSMVQPLKFGNGLLNPSHILLGMSLLTHVGIKDNLSPRGKVAFANISVHLGPLRIARLIYH